jgi:uncharacterized protein with NRDE domain
MCVAAIAWRAHPRWLLVAAGNRDEFHGRPAAALAEWDSGILAGRDLEAGGTWLGVAPGRFALVTNRRSEGGPLPGMASRGALVTDYLEGKEPGDGAAMNPFNLITAGPDGAHLLTNFPGHDRRVLTAGIHTLSNGGLDELWFKEVRLANALERWLGAEAEPEALLADLRDPVPDPEQADSPFSPVFIVHPDYGTRCSTVVAVDRDGSGLIAERSFDPGGAETGTVRREFRWNR